MKKTISLFFVGLMTLSLVGCDIIREFISGEEQYETYGTIYGKIGLDCSYSVPGDV